MINPSNLPKIDIKDIQSNSGIYFFFDKEDLVYIGMSLNIKRRIKNHNIFKKEYTISYISIQNIPLKYRDYIKNSSKNLPGFAIPSTFNFASMSHWGYLSGYIMELEKKYIIKFKPKLNHQSLYTTH